MTDLTGFSLIALMMTVFFVPEYNWICHKFEWIFPQYLSFPKYCLICPNYDWICPNCDMICPKDDMIVLNKTGFVQNMNGYVIFTSKSSEQSCSAFIFCYGSAYKTKVRKYFVKLVSIEKKMIQKVCYSGTDANTVKA